MSRHKAHGEAPAERLDPKSPAPRSPIRTFSSILCFTLPFVGCMPDDWNGQPYLGPTGTTIDDSAAPDDPSSLGGAWVSENEDLSELFAAEPFLYVRVEVNFTEAGAYSVASTDADGAQYLLSGTFEADDGAPGTVVLSQTSPYEAIAAGIWEVTGDTLTWEVVQTVPDYGFAPPTPAAGFGSTSGPGLEAGTNVQRYRSAP